MTSHENMRTFVHKFGAILLKDKLAKYKSKTTKTTNSYYNDFENKFMNRTGDYANAFVKVADVDMNEN